MAAHWGVVGDGPPPTHMTGEPESMRRLRSSMLAIYDQLVRHHEQDMAALRQELRLLDRKVPLGVTSFRAHSSQSVECDSARSHFSGQFGLADPWALKVKGVQPRTPGVEPRTPVLVGASPRTPPASPTAAGVNGRLFAPETFVRITTPGATVAASASETIVTGWASNGAQSSQSSGPDSGKPIGNTSTPDMHAASVPYPTTTAMATASDEGSDVINMAESRGDVTHQNAYTSGGSPLDLPKNTALKFRASEVAHVDETLNNIVTVVFQRPPTTYMGGCSSWETVVDMVMAVIICLNTAELGISADVWPEWFGWVVLQFLFATAFSGEVLFKIGAYGIRWYWTGPDRAWNALDFVLCVTAYVEATFALSIQGREDFETSLFRVVRIIRIAKVARLSRLSIFADLVMMLDGAVAGAKTFMWGLVLLSVPVYAVALVMRETVGRDAQQLKGAEMFNSVGESFFTLFRCCITGECDNADGKPTMVLVTQAYGWGYGIIYCVSVLFIITGLMNVIAAIYVENITRKAQKVQNDLKHERLMDADLFKACTQELLMLIWEHHKGHSRGHRLTNVRALAEVKELEITPGLFENLCNDPRFHNLLDSLDVPPEDRMNLFDTFDVDGGGTLDLHEFVLGISRLRGDARRSDVVSVGLIARSLQRELRDFQDAVLRILQPHQPGDPDPAEAVQHSQMTSATMSLK